MENSLLIEVATRCDVVSSSAGLFLKNLVVSVFRPAVSECEVQTFPPAGGFWEDQKIAFRGTLLVLLMAKQFFFTVEFNSFLITSLLPLSFLASWQKSIGKGGHHERVC